MIEEMRDVEGSTVETYEVIETEAEDVVGVEDGEVEAIDGEETTSSGGGGGVMHTGHQNQQQMLNSGQQQQQQQKRIRRHQCQQCPSNFPRQTELNTHKWLVHGIFCSLLVEECPETDCDFTCESKGLLLEHLYFAHNVDVKLVSAQLDTEADFDLWLQQFQYEHSSEFVLCTTQSNAKYRTRLYTCVFEAQPKRCDPHKSLRVKRQCAAHLLVKVPRSEGKGKVEVLGSSHHNHVTSPVPAPVRDVLETDDESGVMLPQSASLFEMFQTAQQVIQLSDELRAELTNGGTSQSADHMAQVEMKLLQLRQVLAGYDQPVCGGLQATVSEMAVVSADGVVLEEAGNVVVGEQVGEDGSGVVMETFTSSGHQQQSHQQTATLHRRQDQLQHQTQQIQQIEMIDASQMVSDEVTQSAQQTQHIVHHGRSTRSQQQQMQHQEHIIMG
ncbi:hypothetical protein BIW11_05387 [Tropilaelaps mercedesae]|uniref:C2H2-type domain-containing protein n=1 Tax=Tropilaelaps mercedesae TaxID=418985 RepID=A0A1V9Y2K5_9ACAR|nr:hypothetical protein BIW11_05387 [Tropilaelaps mercedesae]